MRRGEKYLADPSECWMESLAIIASANELCSTTSGRDGGGGSPRNITTQGALMTHEIANPHQNTLGGQVLYVSVKWYRMNKIRRPILEVKLVLKSVEDHILDRCV